MPRFQPFGPSVGLALLGLGTALGAASSCSSATPDPSVELPPASASARAEARRQRELRQEALEELQGQPKSKKAKSPPPPKAPTAPTPPPASSGEGGAGGAGGAAGGADAEGGAGGAGGAADAPVDLSALCDRICERAVTCARETMPPELQGNAGPMLEAMAASCGNRCREQAEKADGQDIEKGKACLDESCEDFMSCVSDLM